MKVCLPVVARVSVGLQKTCCTGRIRGRRTETLLGKCRQEALHFMQQLQGREVN
ncbi:hypothetical protein KI387_004839, partial [Taxus chinensis]